MKISLRGLERIAWDYLMFWKDASIIWAGIESWLYFY